MSTRIICIVGKTASGKDTVTAYLKRKYGIPQVCSYTTRPMRTYERNGVEHYFVSKKEFDKVLNTEHVLAYTQFDKTGIEYCATIEGMKAPLMSYIIDPNGIAYMQQFKNQIECKSVYIYVPDTELLDRALLRGDNIETVYQRMDSEHRQFNDFYRQKKYDYLIENHDLRKTYEAIDDIMAKLDWATAVVA